jgi:hypothetical protein
MKWESEINQSDEKIKKIIDDLDNFNKKIA